MANMKQIGKLQARVFHVDIAERGNQQWVTYNAKVSMINDYVSPIDIRNISCTTLKTANRDVVPQCKKCTLKVEGGKEEGGGQLPGKKNTTVEVPIRVERSKLTTLRSEIRGAWNDKYQLQLVVTVDLPVLGRKMISLDWKGEIESPL